MSGTIQELAAKWEAYVAAGDAIEAIYNRPCTPEGATVELDAEMERLSRQAEHMALLIGSCLPANAEEARTRAEILIKEALRCGTDLDTVADLANEQAAWRQAPVAA